MPESSFYPPIMILGCGRSGTSIFGELFQDVGAYTYYSEPPFQEVLRWFADGIVVKVPTESELYPPDPGLSIQLDPLLENQPETRFFWIVRHPLDTVCSLKAGIENNWGHHPRPPDWQNWRNRPLIEQCAHHWSYINSHGYDAICDRVSLVRFEDMIRSPYEFASNVLSSIGVSIDQYSDVLSCWAKRVQNTNNDRFIEAMTSRNYSRPDHSVRIGRWRENLSIDDARSIVPILKNANSHFGYDLGT